MKLSNNPGPVDYDEYCMTGANKVQLSGPCENYKPLFDVALERLLGQVIEYENIIDSINAVVFFGSGNPCGKSAEQGEPKVINVINRIIDALETNNKRLHGIKDALQDHFGDLKL